MKLIIVRHGETEDNFKGIVQGHNHGKLTEIGINQAKKLGLRLKDEKIDVIYSSDLQRAKDTAKEIVKFHKVPVYYSEDIRERNLGIFQGRKREEMFSAAEKEGKGILDFKPLNGESGPDVVERAKKFLAFLKKNHKGKTVLVVSHGGFMKCLLSVLMKTPLEKVKDIKLGNTCVNVAEFKGGKVEMHLVGCVKHL